MDFSILGNINFREVFLYLKQLFFPIEVKWDGTPQPTYEVHCSCGRLTILIFDTEKEEFESLDSTWKNKKYVGWYCGRRCHTQAAYGVMPEKDGRNLPPLEYIST